MLWRRRDMGSDPIHPTFVTTDVPIVTVDGVDGEFVAVPIPVEAYKRLVDWCSLGRTLDNTISCLSDGSPDADRTHLAWIELEDLQSALCEIHAAIRQHYLKLPLKCVEKP